MARVNTYKNRKGEVRFQVTLTADEIPAYVNGDLNADIAKGLKAAAKQAK